MKKWSEAGVVHDLRWQKLHTCIVTVHALGLLCIDGNVVAQFAPCTLRYSLLRTAVAWGTANPLNSSGPSMPPQRKTARMVSTMDPMCSIDSRPICFLLCSRGADSLVV